MSCAGLKGQELKDCQAKSKKRKGGYEDGSATKNTTVDLNSINFANKDVVTWEKKKGGERKTSSGGNLAFGGASLKGSKMRLHRKKNNRSKRA
jgi:hypothetical protein